VRDGLPKNKIAKIHQRTPGAITSRIEHLGLV